MYQNDGYTAPVLDAELPARLTVISRDPDPEGGGIWSTASIGFLGDGISLGIESAADFGASDFTSSFAGDCDCADASVDW